MLHVGLHLTKNPEKYKKLLKLLISKIDNPKKFNFIQLSTSREISNAMEQLNILHCYQIKPVFFKSIENLKWIQIGASGIEKSLFNDVLKSKVIITNASGINALPVSEYVFSCIFYFSKCIFDFIKFKQNREWSQWDIVKKIIQIQDQTIGIIGYGNLGKAIAQKAKAFNMQVIATRRLQKKNEKKKYVDQLIPLSSLNILLKQSDYVVIACPLTPLTKNLINLKEFKIMKKNAIIINVARGEIINEDNLIYAIKNKIIRGAALDVYNNEPINKNNKLFKLNNVLLSPHIAGNYKGYQNDMINHFAENLNRFILNKPLKNRICKKRLY